MRGFNLSEWDIRRLYRGTGHDLRALSDPYLRKLIQSLMSQGLNIRQIMRDPAFMEYSAGLKDERVTGRENMASDLAWVEKFRNIEKDSFNALLLQNQMGVPGELAAGGSGGGGGGGGGYGGGGRGYSRYGSGGDDQKGPNPRGELDISVDTKSEGDWYSPYVNQIVWGAGGMIPQGKEKLLQAYMGEIKGLPNELQLNKFLEVAMANKPIPGETEEEFIVRQQKLLLIKQIGLGLVARQVELMLSTRYSRIY